MDTQNIQINLQPVQPEINDNNEILDISIEIDEDDNPTLIESKKIEADLKAIEDINSGSPIV